MMPRSIAGRNASIVGPAGFGAPEAGAGVSQIFWSGEAKVPFRSHDSFTSRWRPSARSLRTPRRLGSLSISVSSFW
jgi:hypothetical protein